MGQGRRSAGEQSSIGYRIERRIEPPSDLSVEQSADFRKIVAKFAADYFGADNAPLLAELVKHMSYARQINDEMKTLRSIPLSVPLKGEKRRPAFYQLLREAREESRVIGALATKLRLTPQS